MLGPTALALLAMALAPSGPQPLSDRAILEHATRPYDRRAMMNQHVVLGVHHGARVVVDFPCSDICPSYTTRIVHYDVEPGAACDRVRGVVREVMVPSGIAANRRSFCVPSVLGTEFSRLGGG